MVFQGENWTVNLLRIFCSWTVMMMAAGEIHSRSIYLLIDQVGAVPVLCNTSPNLCIMSAYLDIYP